jgi:formylglycine-generating enzyme required for sulfatase activity
MNVRAILSIGAAMALPTAGRVLLAVTVATAPVVAIAATDEFALSTNFHRFLISRATAFVEADMRIYTNTIPGTNVTYRMAPVRGGEFLMGSPGGEAGRRVDEGPQHRVRIQPFWMGACEVTWNEFDVFMGRIGRASRPASVRARDPFTNALADSVALPSHPYIDQSMGMGREGYPAINMTQHAANKYCQWLSALTGHFYRLPTEAEWEYACRAATASRYFFGDDEKQLGEYAWFERNSDFKYQKVGRKKPNAWGLYDLHGNVAEWTLDGYDAGTYATIPDGALDPHVRARRPYPHAVRGGSWKDDAARLRSASRQFSSPKWKEADPSLPRSIWHMAEADFVGFRIVRPLRIPSAEEMHRAWNNGVELE